jgi:hypothetical protein
MRPALTGLVPLLLCLSLAAQEKVWLRYRFQPGTTSWLMTTQEVTQDMQVKGHDQKMTMTLSMWMEGKVTEVKAGVANIEQRYARVKAKSDSAMLQLDYDSDVPGSDPGALRVLADMIGKTAKVRVDDTGRMQDVALPRLGDMQQVGDLLKQGFEQQFAAWPAEPLAVGDSWKSSMEFPIEGMGKIKATVVNKLIAARDNMVTIEQTMEMDTSGVNLPRGLKVEVGKAGGTSRYSLDSFMPVESTMDMQIQVTGEKDPPLRMTLTQHMAMKQVEPPAKQPADARAGGK